MIFRKGVLVLSSLVLLATAGCGTDDDEDETDSAAATLTATGSCTISGGVSDQTFTSCLQYVEKSSAIVTAAEDACVATDDSLTYTWAETACSTEGAVGTCAIESSGYGYEVIYSGDYTAETAEEGCDTSEGTFTPAS